MATKRTSKTIYDAGEIAQEAKKDEDIAVVEKPSVDKSVEYESKDTPTKLESSVWKMVDYAHEITYVMNVPTGCIVRTESPKGSAMCFIQNVKYENGFRRTT